MQLKKTTSVASSDIHHTQHSQPDQSDIDLHNSAAVARVIRKVPTIVQSTLRKRNSEINSSKKEEKGGKSNVMGDKMRSFFNNMLSSAAKIKKCEICEGQLRAEKGKKKNVFMCGCEHKYSFCESCLHHYAIYKINTFEEVKCPHEGCQAVLELNSPFLKLLPLEIQGKYRKIHRFYTTLKDPSCKMCPRQYCEGIAKKSSENQMLCNECKQVFCAKCLLEVHGGECDNQELQFFQNNLHYRQCKRCKFVIEKDSGCNHMTCLCGYQFCYVCGKDWAPPHYNQHDQNGELVVRPEERARPERVEADAGVGVEAGQREISCSFACIFCYVVLFPFRLVVLLVYFIFMFIISVIVKDLMVTVVFFLVSILMGMTCYTCQILNKVQGTCRIILIIFLPITMVLGMIEGFKQVYCLVAVEIYRDSWDMICSGSKRIMTGQSE